MDQYEEYIEEEEEQVEVGNEEVPVGVVAPRPGNTPLDVAVGPIAGSPESPSPSPSNPMPYLQVPSPPQGSPLGGFLHLWWHRRSRAMGGGCEGRQSKLNNPYWGARCVAQPEHILAVYAGGAMGIESN